MYKVINKKLCNNGTTKYLMKTTNAWRNVMKMGFHFIQLIQILVIFYMNFGIVWMPTLPSTI